MLHMSPSGCAKTRRDPLQLDGPVCKGALMFCVKLLNTFRFTLGLIIQLSKMCNKFEFACEERVDLWLKMTIVCKFENLVTSCGKCSLIKQEYSVPIGISHTSGLLEFIYLTQLYLILLYYPHCVLF